MKGDTLQRFLLSCCLPLCITGVSPSAADQAPAPQRPNIILILADDLGFSDLGCYGSEIATPNLDALAAGGMRFTQFYNAARCCPSRAALLTGQYPHAVGVGHMCADYQLPGYQTGLSDRCVTIAEVLRQSGYHALMSGKWHVGMAPEHRPLVRGFEHYFGILSGACNYFRPEPHRMLMLDDRRIEPVDPSFYMTDAITERAVEYIDQYAGRDKPFFLYVAYTAPHAPLHARPEDIARYRGTYRAGWDELRQRRYHRMIELGIIDSRWSLSPRDPGAAAWDDVCDKDREDLKMSVFAAQIDRMDHGVGRIVEKVRVRGIEKNTLILFLSDNGGCAENLDEGKPGAPIGTIDSSIGYGPPWANLSDTPFRRFKRMAHEGGIATPLIAYWPSVITRGGAITHEVGHVIDLLPTVLDAAGAEYPKFFQGRDIRPADGLSLLPVLRGHQREGHELLAWEHEGHRAVRCGRWKLVSYFPDPWELYDLELDRTELHNLADRMPDKVRELADRYEAWARRCNVVPWETISRRARSKADKTYLEQGRPKEPVVIEPGEPQLFVDDWILDSSLSLMRMLHRPVKDNGGQTPVIAPPEGERALVAKGSILFDPRLKSYVMFCEALPSTKIHRYISPDGLTWSDSGPIELDGSSDIRRLDRVARSPSAAEADGSVPADEYCASTAWRYGPLWLGESVVWHSRDDCPWSAAGCAAIKLISSRDGLNWHKVVFEDLSGTPEVFIPAGRQGGNNGRNDGGCLSLFSQGPLRIGDELVFYYGASSYGKNASQPDGVSGGGIFRARLRPDGFVSVTGLALTTRPLQFKGRELIVNSNGPIIVEALSPEGQVEGTAFLATDGIAHLVRFAGRSLADVLPDNHGRLRFQVEQGAHLYSFTIR